MREFTSHDQLSVEGVEVIDFSADWCGPCKVVAPVLDELSGTYSDVTFGKVNVDTAQALASGFNVMSVPTIVFTKDGREVDRLIGSAPKGTIIRTLDSVMAED